MNGRPSRQRSPRDRHHWSGPATLIVGLALIGMVYAVIRDERSQRDLPDDYGTQAADAPPIPADLPHVEPFEGCRIAHPINPWARPGTPWTAQRRGETTAHYINLGWPRAAAEKATYAIEHTPSTTTIVMGNHGGTADGGGQGIHGMTFRPVFDTSYRKHGVPHSCRHSRTNFANNARTETAPAWRIEHEGVTRWAGAPIDCGNVGAYHPGPLGDVVPPPAPPPADPSPPPAADPGAPAPAPPAGAAQGQPAPQVFAVDEPGVIWLLAAAAVGLLAMRRRP